jgi:hypothetical protein
VQADFFHEITPKRLCMKRKLLSNCEADSSPHAARAMHATSMEEAAAAIVHKFGGPLLP